MVEVWEVSGEWEIVDCYTNDNDRGIIAGERRRDFVLLMHGVGMGGKWGVGDCRFHMVIPMIMIGES